MPNSTAFPERELVVIKRLEFPRQLVYKAWFDLRLSLRWWGSTGYVATHAQIDLRAGGTWSGRFRKSADGTESRSVGIIHEIIPYARVIYTYAWEENGDRGPDTLVTLSFAEVSPVSTKLTMHQRPFRTREERDHYKDAWEETLDRFALFLGEEKHRISAASTMLAAE